MVQRLARNHDLGRLRDLHVIADRHMSMVLRHLGVVPRAALLDEHEKRVEALRRLAHQHLDHYFDAMLRIVATERAVGDDDKLG